MKTITVILFCFATIATAGEYRFARSQNGYIDLRDKLPLSCATNAALWLTGDYAQGLYLLDYSPNANHGELTNGAAVVPPRGISKGYVNFDGVNDHVKFTNTASLRPAGDFTIVTWERTTNNSSSYIWQSYNYSPDKGIIVAVQSSAGSGRAQVQVNNGTVYNLNGATQSCVNLTRPWTQVAFTHFGSTNRIYINGAADAVLTGAGNATYNAINYCLLGAGRYDTGSFYGAYFLGAIDRCYLFNRALTAAELLALYNQQRPDYYPTLQWRVTTQYFPWDAVRYNRKIIVSSSGGPSYPASYQSHVEAFNEETGAKVQSLALTSDNAGNFPGANALVIAGSTIYVPVAYTGAVAEVDAETLTLTTWITGLPDAYALAVQDTNLWVGCTNGWVYCINRNTRLVSGSAFVGTNSLPRRMVWDQWSNMWVTCFVSNYVAKINTESYAVEQFFTNAKCISPWGITYAPANSNIYVASYGTDVVFGVSITSGVVTTTWGLGATNGQHDLVHTGERMFVVCSQIDGIREKSLTYGPGNTMGDLLLTGDDPDGLLWDGETESLYCTSALEPSLEKWRVPRVSPVP